MFKLLVAALGAYASVNTIPIQFRPDGSVVIPNLLVPGLINPTHDAVLTMNRQRVLDLEWRENQLSLFTGEMVTENGFQFGRDLRLDFRSARSAYTSIEIGIGPISDIVYRYEAINVLRTSSNDGSLILGGADSETSFRRSCVPGTIITVPIRSEIGVAMEFFLNLTTGPVRHIADTLNGPYVVLHRSEKILRVPLTMANAIIDIIIGTGAIPNNRHRSRFSNCISESVIPQLPEIVLRFPGSRFILYPEDYMMFNNDSNECAFNFEISSDRLDDPFINPLRFPFVNLHITRTQMLICDSLA